MLIHPASLLRASATEIRTAEWDLFQHCLLPGIAEQMRTATVLPPGFVAGINWQLVLQHVALVCLCCECQLAQGGAGCLLTPVLVSKSWTSVAFTTSSGIGVPSDVVYVPSLPGQLKQPVSLGNRKKAKYLKIHERNQALGEQEAFPEACESKKDQAS